MKEGYSQIPAPHEQGDNELVEKNGQPFDVESKTSESSENPIIEIAQALAADIIAISKTDESLVLSKQSIERFIADHLKARVQVGRPDEVKDPFENASNTGLDQTELDMLLTRTLQELELKNVLVTG